MNKRSKAVKIVLKEFTDKPAKTEPPKNALQDALDIANKEQPLPQDLIRRISRENRCSRSIALMEEIEKRSMATIQERVLTGGQDYLAAQLSKFSEAYSEILKQVKEDRINSLQGEVVFLECEEDRLERVTTAQITQNIRLQKDEVHRKETFRQKQQDFQPQIQLVHQALKTHSQVLPEEEVRRHLLPRYEAAQVRNEEALRQAERSLNSYYDSLIDHAIQEIDKVQDVRVVRRVSRVNLERVERERMAKEYPRLMGVLVTPFMVFSD